MATEVITPPGILSFPHLFTPRAAVQGAEPRYSACLIFDDAGQKHANYAKLKSSVLEAIEEEWGAAKAKDTQFIKSLRLPFRDAGEKDYEGYGKGKIFINPWNKSKPGIVDRNGADIMVPADVFAGQIARFAVRPYAYQQSGNKGVSLSLVHVQIIKADMPRLDGRKSAQQTFAGEDLPPDLGGLDDDSEIPF